MKRHFSFVAIGALIAAVTVACAPRSPEQVSERAIADYKQGVREGCLKRGKDRGFDAGQVSAMCVCLFEQMDRSLGEPGWRRLVYLDIRGAKAEVGKILQEQAAGIKHCAPILSGPAASQ